MDQTQTFPKGCPGQGEKMDAWLQEYDEPLDRLMAQKSALCSPDHSECRLAKTMRFAKDWRFAIRSTSRGVRLTPFCAGTAFR